jgi:hypothetical protein
VSVCQSIKECDNVSLCIRPTMYCNANI